MSTSLKHIHRMINFTGIKMLLQDEPCFLNAKNLNTLVSIPVCYSLIFVMHFFDYKFIFQLLSIQNIWSKHHKHHFLSHLAFIHCFPPILYLNITYVEVILHICCVIWIHVSNFGQSNSRMLNCNQKIIMWVLKVAVQVITSSWPYYSILTSEFCIVWLQGEFYLQG